MNDSTFNQIPSDQASGGPSPSHRAGRLGRRGVLLGTAALGATTVLAACSDDDSGTGDSGTDAAGDADQTAGGAGTTLGGTADIPVGGGKVFKDQRVVVTQPSAGTFKGFSATCTHQGCTVDKIAEGKIICPCHDAHFSIEDGSVASGPARQPLPGVAVAVSGDDIVLS